jgi:predicted ArsR family transcriptional regulator
MRTAASVSSVSRLDVLGDVQLRSTLLFVRAQGHPVTADEVARAVGVPRTAARWRLEKLAGARLVVTGFERRSGRSGPGAGRPSKTYAAAAETTAIEFPRRRYETLVGLLIATLPRRRRSRELSRIGAAFGAELAAAARMRPAAKLATGLERLCRGLGELGFHASVDSVSQEQAVLVSATCPLRPLVVADPDARAIDEGMWCGLVEATVRVPVRRTACRTHACLDCNTPCRILVTLDAPA